MISGGDIEKASKYNITDNRYEIVFKDGCNLKDIAEADSEISELPDRSNEFILISEVMRRHQNEQINIVLFVKD